LCKNSYKETGKSEDVYRHVFRVDPAVPSPYYKNMSF
jgi:hypothetical protein